MSKQRKSIYVPISEEMEEKKLYLIDKGYNLSCLVRNYVRELYDLEKNKEVA